MANPQQQSTTANSGKAPAPTPSKDPKLEAKAAELATELEKNAPAAPQYPPVPGTEKAPAAPTRAQAKLALENIGKYTADLDRLTFLRNEAIQVMIDAGYDERAVKYQGKSVIFSKKQARNGTVTYELQEFEVDDLSGPA